MIIQYASDLHLEFAENNKYMQQHALMVCGEILVLAGDILPLRKGFEEHPFFDFCDQNYKHTYLVPGNHELYRSVFSLKETHQISYPIRNNVTLINNNSIVFEKEDVEFLFSTLWSCIDENNYVQIQMSMNDYRYIRYDENSIFSARKQTRAHVRCEEYLIGVERKANKRIVVTHHCPSPQCEIPKYRNSIYSSAFVCNMEDHLEIIKPNYWIFGHTHHNMFDTKIGDTVFVSNQLGYVSMENPRWFRQDATIVI